MAKNPEEKAEGQESREERLAALFKAAAKKSGAGSLGFAKEFKFKVVPRISTGVLGLDYALGGGMPVGRISMYFGHKSSSKSTTLLRTIGNAQKMCSNCWTRFKSVPAKKEKDPPVVTCGCGEPRETVVAYLDVEGAWDHKWSSIFLDPSKLVFSQPETAEQTIDTADALLRSGAVDIIVIDSVAFMTPMSEIDNSSEKASVGVQARLIGDAMRKFVSGINKMAQEEGRRPTIWLTNQIRMKVGIMFGCFHGDTLVSFVDGRQVRIRDVVKNKLTGKILSYNRETRRIEEANIVNWYNNGKLDVASGEYWLHVLTTGAGGPGGRMGFTCTPNHILFREDGTEVAAGEIAEGETLMSYREDRVMRDPVHSDIILGSLIGDGAIRMDSDSTAAFSLANQEQPEYLAWKCSMLPMLGMRRAGNDFRPRMDSERLAEMTILRDRFYPSGKGYRQIPSDLKLSPLMAAVWYMDDGWSRSDRPGTFISIKRFKNSSGQISIARKMISDFLGCDVANVTYHQSNGALYIDSEVSRRFIEMIGVYIIPSMRHKIPAWAGNIDYCPVNTSIADPVLIPHPVTILEVKTASAKKHRDLFKYDLQIDGNSTYLVGGGSRGIVVHNSPEVQPGGLAQGFATSCEVRCGSGKYEMDEETGKPISVLLKFKVEKNKTSSAKIEGEYRMILSKTEVKNVGDVLDEDWAIAMGEKVCLLEGGRNRITYRGQVYDGRSVLARHWMLHPDEYQTYKDELLPIILAI